MSDINNLPKSMPATEHSFQIELTGETTGQRFVGEFTCRVPTLKDQSLIARHEATLNGEMVAYLNPGVLKLNKYISYLRFTLKEVPPFWRKADLGYELRDFNIIEAVYAEVLDFEKKWLAAIWGEDQDGSTEEKED